MIFRSRYRYLIIFLIFAILTPLLFLSSAHFTRQQGLTELAADTENDLMLFARQLEQRLIGYDHLSGSISTSRQILAVLRNPYDSLLVSAANQ
ncbi:MAG: hypothetical protein KZQ73_15610, partial [Candidatus Thiodiazotropha sp. (ex Semelilucina semeliformis)]|nr:hypothetical protein [Candidatus Thiodiazotropha sp. (ex Semelilucina semeliformis)]